MFRPKHCELGVSKEQFMKQQTLRNGLVLVRDVKMPFSVH